MDENKHSKTNRPVPTRTAHQLRRVERLLCKLGALRRRRRHVVRPPRARDERGGGGGELAVLQRGEADDLGGRLAEVGGAGGGGRLGLEGVDGLVPDFV